METRGFENEKSSEYASRYHVTTYSNKSLLRFSFPIYICFFWKRRLISEPFFMSKKWLGNERVIFVSSDDLVITAAFCEFSSSYQLRRHLGYLTL